MTNDEAIKILTDMPKTSTETSEAIELAINALNRKCALKEKCAYCPHCDNCDVPDISELLEVNV